MHFDWVTWSIWLVGLVILVIWIIFPLKEFAAIVKSQRAAHKERMAAGGEGRGDTESEADNDA